MQDCCRNEIKITKVESLYKLKNYISMFVKNNSKKTLGEEILIFEFRFFHLQKWSSEGASQV